MNHNTYIPLTGLAYRAGRLIMGTDAVVTAIQENKVKLILLAADISAHTRSTILSAAESSGCLVTDMPCGKNELGGALGRAAVSVAALTDIGFASAIVERMATENPERYGETSMILKRKFQRMKERRAVQAQKHKVPENDKTDRQKSPQNDKSGKQKFPKSDKADKQRKFPPGDKSGKHKSAEKQKSAQGDKPRKQKFPQNDKDHKQKFPEHDKDHKQKFPQGDKSGKRKFPEGDKTYGRKTATTGPPRNHHNGKTTEHSGKFNHNRKSNEHSGKFNKHNGKTTDRTKRDYPRREDHMHTRKENQPRRKDNTQSRRKDNRQHHRENHDRRDKR